MSESIDGETRLKMRHDLHMVVRGAISDWNDRKQVLHFSHKIDLAAEITEKIFREWPVNQQSPQEPK